MYKHVILYTKISDKMRYFFLLLIFTTFLKKKIRKRKLTDPFLQTTGDEVDHHNVIHEKYEFESTEKIMSKANSKSSTAWSSEDQPDDTPFDNDR